MCYTGFIYEWVNVKNGKKYLGSHMGDENDGYTGSGKLFKRALKKYGKENFIRSIIEYINTADKHVLLEREKYWLEEKNAVESDQYYNIAKDVIGGNTKAGWSLERREQFRERIRQVWANRTVDQIRCITQKRKNTIGPERLEEMRQKMIIIGKKNIMKAVAATQKRTAAEKSEAAKRGRRWYSQTSVAYEY